MNDSQVEQFRVQPRNLSKNNRLGGQTNVQSSNMSQAYENRMGKLNTTKWMAESS